MIENPVKFLTWAGTNASVTITKLNLNLPLNHLSFLVTTAQRDWKYGQK